MSEANAVSAAEVDHLYKLLIEIVEKVSKGLYRNTVETLRKINPTLDELADICSVCMGLLMDAGETKIKQFDEAVGVIKEAALAVGSGDHKTITDCAYHLEDFLDRFKKT